MKNGIFTTLEHPIKVEILARASNSISPNPPNQITIRPTILSDLTFAEADYQSALGKISSKWDRKAAASPELVEGCQWRRESRGH